MRFVAAEYADRVSADQTFNGLLYGFKQIAVIQMIDQMRDHFGVGLAFENIAQRFQFCAQFFVVFDNAVMHEGDTFTGEVRVGVFRGGYAMGCPAGVCDTSEAGQAALLYLFLQFCHAGSTAAAAQTAVNMQRNAAGIIATVFQTFQAFQQDRGDVSLRNRADDTAHNDSR